MRKFDILKELIASVLAAVGFAVAMTELLPAADAVYVQGGPIFTTVAVLESVTALSPPKVVAGLTGILAGLFLLYILDEARRVVALFVVGAGWWIVLPELVQLGRIVGSIDAAPAPFFGMVLVTALVAGADSLRTYTGTSYEVRGTLANLRRAKFRRPVKALYVVLLGWITLVVVRALLSPKFESPVRLAGAGLVAIASTVVLFRYQSETSVAIVGVGGDTPKQKLLDGLSNYVDNNYRGFDLKEHENRDDRGFGYRVGKILSQTILVSVVDRTLKTVRDGSWRNGSRTSDGFRARDKAAILVGQWFPNWITDRLPLDGYSRVQMADTVVFAVEFPQGESNTMYEGLQGATTAPLSAWVRLYDNVPGTTVVVVATGASCAENYSGGESLGDTTLSSTAAINLGLQEKADRVVAVDENAPDDGGFEDLLEKL